MKLVIYVLIIAQVHMSMESIEEFSDDEVDKDNFVDIHDMGPENHEDLFQDQTPDSKSTTGIDSKTSTKVQILENLIEPENENKEASVSNINTEVTLDAENYDKGLIFFQQFLKRIVHLIDKDTPKDLEDNRNIYYKTVLELKPTEISFIRDFAKANTKEAKHYLNEAHHIISKSFSYLILQTEIPLELKWKFEDTFGLSANELLMKEVAARASKASNCRSIEVNGVGYGEMLYSLFLPVNNKLQDCYQDILVDPWTTIPPTKVIAFTLATFVFEPLEHIGLGFKKFLMSFFTDLHPTLWLFACVLIIIGIVLPMCLYMNYEVRLPAFLGAIGPSQTAATLCIECRNSATVLRNNNQSQLAYNRNVESRSIGQSAIERRPENNLKDASTQSDASKICLICKSTQTVILTKEVAISTIAIEKTDKHCQIDDCGKVKEKIQYDIKNET
ncbi:DgyrCDS449 [Dimorphilus gyrociliatus]|uniref:Chloride channel CLIC-like protein 1 n=1 Tax=Dimorphilus gyrociliatus TaxID=2664684 RepID=A0A7I8V4H0_9ANNE|nr:DgyrCDS449 [Dimorphilus gyrociliatus]